MVPGGGVGGAAGGLGLVDEGAEDLREKFESGEREKVRGAAKNNKLTTDIYFCRQVCQVVSWSGRQANTSEPSRVWPPWRRRAGRQTRSGPASQCPSESPGSSSAGTSVRSSCKVVVDTGGRVKKREKVVEKVVEVVTNQNERGRVWGCGWRTNGGGRRSRGMVAVSRRPTSLDKGGPEVGIQGVESRGVVVREWGQGVGARGRGAGDKPRPLPASQ